MPLGWVRHYKRCLSPRNPFRNGPCNVWTHTRLAKRRLTESLLHSLQACERRHFPWARYLLHELDTLFNRFERLIQSIFLLQLRTDGNDNDDGNKQWECHQTKGSISKTMAVHVRYESLYSSLPSPANQDGEMIKFCVVRGTRTTTSNFFIFPFVIERCYFIFEPDPGTEGSGQLWISLVKFKFIFACLRPGRQCLTHYCSRVDRHIPRTTHDLVISRSCFAEDGKEVQIELWRTRTTIVLLTFFVWWRSRYHRRRGLRLPNVSLLWRHTQRYKQSVCWNIIIAEWLEYTTFNGISHRVINTGEFVTAKCHITEIGTRCDSA